MDIITYGKSKTYTNQTAEEFGGLKGANCTIKSITPISGGNRVTFEWKNTEGATQEGTLDVMDGVDGNDGLGIKSVTINASNHLIITYDDDTTEDAGEVPTVQGEDGKSAYEIAVEHGYSGTEEEWLESLKGDKGDDGEGVPTGGTTGQFLVKKSSTDYDTEWGTPAGGGDMLKSVYDTDNDGKVDSAENADTVDGHTVAKDVPADAEFTDTVYDDTEIRGEIADKVDKVSGKGLSTEDYTSEEKTKLAGVEASAEVNTIESITLNGTEVTPDANKNVALTVITNAVNDLVNYYLKSETYTKTEVDDIVTAIKNSRFEVVATLPTTDIKTNVIYLVPKSPSQTSNVKDEYINLDGTTSGWEKIGDTEIDLSGYVTTEALNTALADYTTTADLTTLLAGKQDTLTFDNVPTENSNNPVKSGGVYSSIKTVKDALDDEVEARSVLGAKNLLDLNLTTPVELNGLIFTKNSDGSITVSGIATANTEKNIATFTAENSVYEGSYILSGCPSGGGNNAYVLSTSIKTKSPDTFVRNDVDKGNGVSTTITSAQYLQRVFIYINNGMDLTTPITFYPMLRLATDADSTYQPYAKTNKQLTKDKAEQAEVNDINNVLGAKNLLNSSICAVFTPNYIGNKVASANGLTFTWNNDGTLIVDGTPTDSSVNVTVRLDFTNDNKSNTDISKLAGKKIIASLGHEQIGTESLQIKPGYFDSNGSGYQISSDIGVYGEYTYGLDAKYARTYIVLRGNTSYDNIKLSPMLRLASNPDDTYEPYAKGNQQLTKETTGLLDNVNKLGAKNLLPNNAKSQTYKGITWTVNDDGSITANGTSDGGSYIRFVPYGSDFSKILPSNIPLTISCECSSNTLKPSGYTTYFALFAASGSGTEQIVEMDTVKSGGHGVTKEFTAQDLTFVNTYIQIADGVTVNNVTFYPMIRLASDPDSTYVPYAKSNLELTKDILHRDLYIRSESSTLSGEITDLLSYLAEKFSGMATYSTLHGVINSPYNLFGFSAVKGGASIKAMLYTDTAMYSVRRLNNDGTITAYQYTGTAVTL